MAGTVTESALYQGRTVFVVGPSPDAKGGIASVLACLRSQGFFDGTSIALVSSFDTGSRWRKAVVAVKALSTFFCALVARRVALLHVHSASGASLLRKSVFVMLASVFDRPIVFQMHNGAFVERFEGSSRFWQAYVKWVLRMSSCVVVLTQAQQHYVSRTLCHPWVELFPNPVEIPEGALLSGQRDATAVFLANLTEAKGLFDLLAAWRNVHRQVPSARLLIGGLGDEGKVREAVARLGIESSVDCLGWVGADRRSTLLSKAGLVVLPSRSEALPMSVLEGMAYGCPVVATAVGAVPLAVRDGAEGLLVAIADIEALAAALVVLLKDEAVRTRMGRAARHRAEDFYSPEAVMRRTRDLYGQIIDRR
jgi:glycosyltransferase involved in cell wall biosynthesis